MSYRVVIPTAGIGSRLGNFTKYLNKSLISLNHKPTISYIIEMFPKNCEFVIPLGYKASVVRDFLEITYPNKKFFFVNIKPFKGKGSGLGLTLIKCKKYLQQPFVFISCDTIVNGKIRPPNHNWMGYYRVNNSLEYRTLKINKKNITQIHEKKENKSTQNAYIGLSGIKDYKIFWDSMSSNNKKVIVEGESYGFKKLINFKKVKSYSYKWFDTGNIKNLNIAKNHFKKNNAPNILEKKEEAIWFVGDNVIKFSNDKKFIKNRILRAKELEGYVPKIQNFRENMYLYNKIKGSTLSEIINTELFEKFMSQMKKFWIRNTLSKKKELEFRSACLSFYKVKTYDRLKLFYKNFDLKDNNTKINGKTVPLLSNLLRNIDWIWLSKGIPGRYHGDFHFENILLNEQNKFIFLDWRQDFAGDLVVGDINYDLAKLMHGLIINHGLIISNQYRASWIGNEINFRFSRKRNLIKCEGMLFDFIKKMGYDIKKIKILTSLIFLNIASLHHFPYSLLLYGLGKKMLYDELNN